MWVKVMRLSRKARGDLTELATLENVLLACEPTRRIVPTTNTRITASITAYSAISCPESSKYIFRNSSRIATSAAIGKMSIENNDDLAYPACQMKEFAKQAEIISIKPPTEMQAGRKRLLRQVAYRLGSELDHPPRKDSQIPGSCYAGCQRRMECHGWR